MPTRSERERQVLVRILGLITRRVAAIPIGTNTLAWVFGSRRYKITVIVEEESPESPLEFPLVYTVPDDGEL